MAYTLQAVIGEEPDLNSHAAHGAQIVPLAQGKAMIPITEVLREQFDIPFLEFGHTEEALQHVSAFMKPFKKKVAYVEAEFFGGIGNQASAVWEEEKLIFGPLLDEHAIDQALVLLGVEKGAAYDEFDALDLGRCRNTEEWK